MIIVMRSHASKAEIDEVIKKIEKMHYKPHIIQGVERTVIGAVGDERGKERLQSLESMTGVEKVMPILQPYKLSSREFKHDNSVINVGNVKIGGNEVVIIAGPCSVESKEQMIESAEIVKKAGAKILRGGAFKPRTSPYSFQGHEEEGLKMLAIAREKTGLPFVTEIMDTGDIDIVAEYTDMLQVGARNVQNFALLKKLGKLKKPILLKRGMMTTIIEFLMSAEYILSEGNPDVVRRRREVRIELRDVPALGHHQLALLGGLGRERPRGSRQERPGGGRPEPERARPAQELAARHGAGPPGAHQVIQGRRVHR